MPRAYEHTFADLHGETDTPAASVVELSPQGDVDATGAVRDENRGINKAPGNPDAGKTDQFEDLPGARKDGAGADVDTGIDIAVEAEDTADADAPEGGEDDLKGLSQGVRERIERERRLRQEAEERSTRVEAELAQLGQKVDLQAKESEWRSADEKDEADLARLKAEKVKAIEEGKTSDQVEIDDKITDVKARKHQREREREQAREAAKNPPRRTNGDPAAKTPKAAEWIRRHPEYNTDPLFREATNAADRLLYSQGFNSNSDDYYQELAQLLSKSGKFKIDPYYLKTGAKRQRGGSPRGGGSNGVRGGNGDVRRAGGRTQVTVTAQDKALLASMGLDTDDPTVIKNYAREKLNQQIAEQRERGER